MIDERTTAGMPTIFTSNVSIDELKDVFKAVDPYGRTFDRVRGYSFELAFEGESKRKA